MHVLTLGCGHQIQACICAPLYVYSTNSNFEHTGMLKTVYKQKDAILSYYL